MVNREECKHFYFGDKELKGIDSPTPGYKTMPMCRIGKMTVGGCRKDCKWFEPK